MGSWSLRCGWWCCLILENAVTLGGPQSSRQGLQIKALAPAAEDANDKGGDSLFAAALGHLVNTDIKARPAYLDRGNSSVYHRTFLYQNTQSQQHTPTYTDMHAHNPSCQCAHKHTVPVETVFPVHSPLPSFSFFSSGVCITGSHRHFLVLSRDILAPDSRSLARCSSGPWTLD